MTEQSTLSTALVRKAPQMGGFSPAIVSLEVRRLLRNRRTMIFSLVMPVFFFLAFGLNSKYDTLRSGQGNESAFVMISFGLYGAVFATASGGAMVSVERVWGWSRQLRVTPLSSTAYIVTKMLTALVLGAGSVLAVYVAGGIANKPSMPLQYWVITATCVWIGSLLFAAFGLFIGYLLPSENVMQIIGIALTLCAFAGGVFIPVTQFSPTLQTLAKFTPLYGLNQLVHLPLIGGSLDWSWVMNLIAWLAIFVGGAIWRFRIDTSRV
jgi:ABC-2 type transport system permease protein